MAYCDLLSFLKQNLDGAPAVTSGALRDRVAQLGTSFLPALTLQTRFGAGGLGGPTLMRPAAFADDSKCFRYTGPAAPAPD